MTPEQAQEAIDFLQKHPPEITNDIYRVVDGVPCHCAVGKLGLAAGMTNKELAAAGRNGGGKYQALLDRLRERFGLTDVARAAIFRANDFCVERDFTPAARGAAVQERIRRLVEVS